MKFISENVGSTLAKMRKLHPELTEHKNLINKKKYFYDFSLLENVPEEIREEAEKEIIKESADLFLDSVFAIPIRGEYQYYIDTYIQRYTVYNTQGKQLYRIMEVVGLRIHAYKFNIFGYVECHAMPEYVKEYGGYWNQRGSYIQEIEIV